MKIILILIFPLFFVGYVTLEGTMAGKIGCPEEEIQVLSSNPGYFTGGGSWRVRCRGQNFICSHPPTVGKNDPTLNNMSCTRELR